MGVMEIAKTVLVIAGLILFCIWVLRRWEP